ncbi:MAG: winged helix-turn-helix transcriptional regulator [Candidatus Kariarchaeaceae archaeon]|jgi:DNA-binding transcriptional ArsR family regulator
MTREKRSLLLMHPVRRSIYQIVSESPGSYFFEIASALELPHGTVSWHLKKLETSGLIDTMRFAGRRVFFSKALRNEEVEKAFVVLRSDATQQVFSYVLNNDNCYQAQIADALGHHHDTVRHHISRLIKARLLEAIRKGRTVHYSLGEIGRLILNSNTEIISKAYVEYLFSRLKEECITPEVIEHGGGKLTIRISCPGKEDVYMSIELKGWQFLPSDFDGLHLTSGDPDDEPETTSEEFSVVKDRSRKPKVVRYDD